MHSSSRSRGPGPLGSVIDTSWSFSGVALLRSCKINRLAGALPCFVPVRRANWLRPLGTSFLSFEAVWAQKVLRLAVSRNRGPGRHREIQHELLSLSSASSYPASNGIFRVTPEGFWGRNGGKVGSCVPCTWHGETYHPTPAPGLHELSWLSAYLPDGLRDQPVAPFTCLLGIVWPICSVLGTQGK